MIGKWGALIMLLLPLSCRGPAEFSGKYYAVDNVEIGEFATIRDSLGEHINTIILQLDATNIALFQELLSEVEDNGLQLIIWPREWGHQNTPWYWDGTNWDISAGTNMLRYAQDYVSSGGTSLRAVLMTHEPYYNNGEPFTTTEIQALYYKLKQAAPDVDLFNYVNYLDYYDQLSADFHIENGIGDIVAIYWHFYGGAEGGSAAEALSFIDADLDLIESRNLDMEILFAIQAFGWDGYDYHMPDSDELWDFGSDVVSRDRLDGIIWYCWGEYAYTETLKTGRYDGNGGDRWQAVRSLRFN